MTDMQIHQLFYYWIYGSNYVEQKGTNLVLSNNGTTVSLPKIMLIEFKSWVHLIITWGIGYIIAINGLY